VKLEKIIPFCYKYSSSQHLHANDIGEWLATVQQRYDDFSARLRKYEQRLHADLGRPDTASRIVGG
jgi:hypothetical protein